MRSSSLPLAFATLGLAVGAGCPASTIPPTTPIALDSLVPEQEVQGFKLEAVYANDGAARVGARFRHRHTGFVFDYLAIQSVPQAFIWVSSFPDSDRGEPHTQEHLLLGKGNKGRYVASQEAMSLVSSSAYTQQLRTCYHMNTSAGPEVFFDLLYARLDSLVNPDYSDEEIRREVHHYGVSQDATTGLLHLDEKGTVYQEMAATFERPWTRMFREITRRLYGPAHPLSFSSGGLPEAIRTMTPEDIRTFHHAHYVLGNMGMIGSFPSSVSLEETLVRVDDTLRRIQPEATAADARFEDEADLPAPAPAPLGEIAFVDYPSASTQVPADIALLWPATRDLDHREKLALDLFLEALAGNDSSNLYRRLVDTKTREVDLGATEVWATSLDQLGTPILAGLGGIPSSRLSEALAVDARARILDEIGDIAALAPGDPALADFNKRVRSQIVARRRALGKFVDSPPGFGFRHGGGAWVEHLRQLADDGAFERSVTLGPELKAALALVEGDANPWTDLIAAWGLKDVTPSVLMTRPDPALVDQLAKDKQARLAAETQAIMARYGATDEQAALTAFKTEYDAHTQEIEDAARAIPVPRFIDNPPLTLDDPLSWRQESVGAAALPLVRSSFPTMSSATFGAYLRLGDLGPADWVYLSELPALMSNVGFADGQEILSFTEALDRQQNEILDLSVSWSMSTATHRLELAVTGSGGDREETRKALAWMGRALYHADWRDENLARIRDVVDSDLTVLRQTMRGSEESWVQDPAWAWRMQDDALYLATQSFLTRTHLALRLKWRLEGDDPAVAADVAGRLNALGAYAGRGDRAHLSELTAALRAGTGGPADAGDLVASFAALDAPRKALALKALDDLDATVGDLPDSSLAADWAALCAQLAVDLSTPPTQALAEMRALRERLLQRPARLTAVGSDETVDALLPDLAALTAPLKAGGPTPAWTPGEPLLGARLAGRGAPADPVFTGLLNPNTQGGVFLMSSDAIGYRDLDEESLLRYLSGMLFSGGGAHSLFMKTWGAGLAYSNGIRPDTTNARMTYYAERSPELPRTMQFVIDELEGAPRDPQLAEYAISLAFTASRAAQGFEDRGAAIAADLADGRPPEVVEAFRKAILAQRDRADLADQLYSRMEAVYGSVLVGYGPRVADVDDPLYMTIGPEAQLEAWERYVRTVEGEGASVTRLYPRDFWLESGATP